jgi:outer membrane protein assembly factor BamD
MTQRTTEDCTLSIQARSSRPVPCFCTGRTTTAARGVLAAGFALAVLLASPIVLRAQEAPAASDPAAAQPAAAQAPAGAVISNRKPAKASKKDDKVVQTKDTKKEVKKVQKTNGLEGLDSKIPDKQLFDKAEDAIKHGRFDVGRLDLQTLLNTYPESQYMMHAKLAIADSWFKEGGTAALTQAEQEYRDFITFFPNAPEAAEAQMRIGDIYFKEMDKPDRDYTATTHAEQEYRLMLQQFPDSPLVPQARQRLREVQETLASREADIANFYSTHSNWPATIARYQTVIDTYPLYSHMDEVLVAVGDAYEAESRFVRGLKLPEAGKARLQKIYDDEAYAAYSKVVLEHSAAPHVEDARDRIVGMGLPIPVPTAEQVAASVALENSRGQYTLSKRATLLFLHQADTVPAATIGEPPLEDAKPTLAPQIVRQSVTDFNTAMNPSAAAPRQGQPIAPAAPADATQAPPAQPMSFQDVPAADNSGTSSSGASLGVEIVQPSSKSQAPITPPAQPPAFPGTTPAAAAPAPAAAIPTPDPMGGIKPVAPTNNTELAPIEKPAVAPDAINEVKPGTQPAAQAPPADGKKAKADIDKSDTSSSKRKPKKGLGKLNPF